MKLKFIGKDGSMGLENGKTYTVDITTTKDYVWVSATQGIFKPIITCPYSCMKLLARNWELPDVVIIDKHV